MNQNIEEINKLVKNNDLFHRSLDDDGTIDHEKNDDIDLNSISALNQDEEKDDISPFSIDNSDI